MKNLVPVSPHRIKKEQNHKTNNETNKNPTILIWERHQSYGELKLVKTVAKAPSVYPVPVERSFLLLWLYLMLCVVIQDIGGDQSILHIAYFF